MSSVGEVELEVSEVSGGEGRRGEGREGGGRGRGEEQEGGREERGVNGHMYMCLQCIGHLSSSG